MWSSHSPAFEPLRMMGVVDAWRHGIWDARWLPLFDQGYGYPIFSYHSPLFSWVGAVFLLLTGQPILALKLSILIFFLIGGLGCRTLASGFWASPGATDRTSGDFAFAGWASATYLFINIFVRGSLSEFAASALIPWLLWGMWLISADARRYAKGAGAIAISLTLLVLCHNAIALYAVLLVCLPLPFLFRPAGSRGWFAWAAGGAMAACMTAFFAVPVWVEKPFVRLANLLPREVRDHFLRVDHLLSLGAWNLGLSGQDLNRVMPRHQGLLLPFALIAGVIAFRYFDSAELRRKTLTLLTLSALTLFMAMLPSVWLWEHLRPLLYTQFPWRWLSVNATVSALLVPALALAIRRRGTDLARHTYTVLAGAVLIVNLGLYGGPGPGWQRWQFDPSPDLVRADKTRTTVDEEYGPVWRNSNFSHPVRPGDAMAGSVEVKSIPNLQSPWRWEVGVRGAATPVVVGANYFPGWRAYWHPNGAPAASEVPVEIDRPTGLILVRLDAGDPGHLELQYANTPVRQALKIFSAASAAAFLAVAIWLRLWRSPAIV